MIVCFLPEHDARIKSSVPVGSQEDVEIELQFSIEMDCDKITALISVNSATEDPRMAALKPKSIKCFIIEN
jgi:alpha-1,3-glucan synthase